MRYDLRNASWDEVESVLEQEEIEDQDAAEDRKRFLACEWVSAKGADIEVWVFGREHIHVNINTETFYLSYERIRPLIAKEQTNPAYKDIVAVLGPVGLTTERKAAIDAKIQEQEG